MPFACSGASQAQHQDVGGTESLEQRQASYDRASQDILATSKPAALLVPKHAQGSLRTRGKRQKVTKEVESKYLEIPNEKICATLEALVTTSTA